MLDHENRQFFQNVCLWTLICKRATCEQHLRSIVCMKSLAWNLQNIVQTSLMEQKMSTLWHTTTMTNQCENIIFSKVGYHQTLNITYAHSCLCNQYKSTNIPIAPFFTSTFLDIFCSCFVHVMGARVCNMLHDPW
jgi:hypothetical protein